MNESLQQRLSAIRLLAMDVDGTLTDGAMYYSAEGEAMKRFDTRDGMGITLLHLAGIQTAIITSETTSIVQKRAEKLRIAHVYLGAKKKNEVLAELCEKLGLTFEEIAYIGDDINDIPAMQTGVLAVCPADAVESVRILASYICSKQGGHGAVRELAEMILIAQGHPIILPEQW